MKPQPFYTGKSLNPAYSLRYSWTGWPSGTCFEGLADDQMLERLRESWEADGLRLLEWNWSDAKIQLTFSTTPKTSPVFLATRAKGRLQDALRKAGTPQKFSRKLSVRSIGDNTTVEVENYIKNQVKERIVCGFCVRTKDGGINPGQSVSRPFGADVIRSGHVLVQPASCIGGKAEVANHGSGPADGNS